MTDFQTQKVKKSAATDGFVSIPGVLPKQDKRLASIAVTTNHLHNDFLQRRRTLVFHLDDIDRIRFNSIPKLELWIEIFNKFKPMPLQEKILITYRTDKLRI